MVETYTPQEVTALMNLVDTYLRHRTLVNKGQRAYDFYHPSEFGKCLRLQQYKHYEWKGLVQSEEEDLDSKKIRLFDKGHNMHARWANYFDCIGDVLLGRWKCKNPLCFMFDDDGNIKGSNFSDVYKEGKTRIHGNDSNAILKPKKCSCGGNDFEYLETSVFDPDINMKGHADILLNFDNLDASRFDGVRITYNDSFLPKNGKKIVGDMKTIGSKAWANQLAKKGAHKEYLIQITIYAHILDCEYGIIMYENKDTSEILWFHVPRNDKWWETIQYQAKQMMEMAIPDEKGNVRLPPPKYDSQKDYGCMYCEFKKICHKSKVWQSPNFEKTRKDFYKCLL